VDITTAPDAKNERFILSRFPSVQLRCIQGAIVYHAGCEDHHLQSNLTEEQPDFGHGTSKQFQKHCEKVPVSTSRASLVLGLYTAAASSVFSEANDFQYCATYDDCAATQSSADANIRVKRDNDSTIGWPVAPIS
jgi:hypothetical protein